MPWNNRGKDPDYPILPDASENLSPIPRAYCVSSRQVTPARKKSALKTKCNKRPAHSIIVTECSWQRTIIPKWHDLSTHHVASRRQFVWASGWTDWFQLDKGLIDTRTNKRRGASLETCHRFSSFENARFRMLLGGSQSTVLHNACKIATKAGGWFNNSQVISMASLSSVSC